MCRPSRPKHREVAVKGGFQLFIKNTGLCQGASRCIQTDACSVTEG